MATIMKQLTLLFCVLLIVNYSVGQDEFSAEGNNVLRIENEIKLAVPDDISKDVWAYLTTKYSNENLSLSILDSSYNSKIDEDLLVDQYFDNLDFQLLAGSNGIRHRIRYVVMDTASRKNGRELMQIKINNINSNEQSRGESKYPIKYYDSKNQKYDNLAFLGLIKREYRESVILLLNQYQIDAQKLFPTIIVEQLRKRIYITKREQTFLTITLDYVSSKYKDKSCNFVELELELNEICYTESDSLTRIEMEKVTSDIKSDLIAKFPSIKQDQTPKYNKSAKALGIDIKKIKQSNKNFVRLVLIIGCSCILVIVVIVILMKRNRKKPKALIRF